MFNQEAVPSITLGTASPFYDSSNRNKEERTGYLVSGFMALTPVKVMAWQLHFYHRP
jgi:hypothetical protein